MRRVTRGVLLAWIAVALTTVGACQSPTSPDDTLDVDDFLAVSVAPDPAIADESTDGATYRVVRGNNQPDDILPFDWKTSFTVSLMLNDRADDKDVLKFPVDLTTVTLQVKQASGGIVTPPTGGETEHFSYVTQASSNRFGAVNASVNIGFDVWYDLPSLRREALVSVSLAFKDVDGKTFSKVYDVKVAR